MYDNLSSLLQSDEAAHSFFMGQPYDIKCALLCNRNEIHTFDALKNYCLCVRKHDPDTRVRDTQQNHRGNLFL